MDEREKSGEDGGVGTVSWCSRHENCLSYMSEGWDLRWCLMRVRRADRDGPAKAASNPQRTAGGRGRGVSGVTPTCDTPLRLSARAVHAGRARFPRLDFASSGSVPTPPHLHPFALLSLSQCRLMIHLTKRTRFAADAQLPHDSTRPGSRLSAQDRDSVASGHLSYFSSARRPPRTSRPSNALQTSQRLHATFCAQRFIDAASRKTKLA